MIRSFLSSVVVLVSGSAVLVSFLPPCKGMDPPVPGSTEPLILVSDGDCRVSVHNVAKKPSIVETNAALDLQAAFQLACGVSPEINPASPAAIEIRLGVADRFSVGVGHSSEQAYAVRRTADDHIELVGNCRAAVAWAVVDFCKRVLHVSWPVSTNTMVLEGEPRSTVAVERLSKVEAPDFPVRGWIIGVNTDGFHYDDTIGGWMAHNRQNAIHNRMDHMTAGGGYHRMLSRGLDVDTTMHTFEWLIPPALYDEHPEYFPLIDGARMRPGPLDMYVQRCISNPEVRDIILRKIERGFGDFPDVNVFGVGHNDGRGGWCQCDDCVAMDGAQAGTGVYSNRLIRFANHLAKTIGPVHPGKYVGILAYSETVEPPDCDLADNVSITFVTSGGNYMKKLTDPSDPANAAILKPLSGWLAKSDNVHLWAHYWTTGMDSCLAPYARTVTGAFSDLKRLGLEGICCETRPPYWASQRLFFYALARAGWDNSLDFDDVLDDYCREAYGPGASAVKSFHRLYEKRIYDHVPVLSVNGAAAQFFPGAFSSGDMVTLDGHLTSAEDAVAGGRKANIDAVAEVRTIFERFKLLLHDPADVPGIGPNLVANPGAEHGADGWIPDVYRGEGDYAFSIPGGKARSGERSFKVECTGKTGLAARWYQTDVPLVKGKKYAFRFWVRASGGAKGSVELYQGPGWGHYTAVAWQDSGDRWVRLVIPRLTADHAKISIWLTAAGPGTVHFDDVFLAELPSP